MKEENRPTFELYKSQLSSEQSTFMRCVLRAAKWKLRNNVDYKKVEQWVVDLEKLWRKLL